MWKELAHDIEMLGDVAVPDMLEGRELEKEDEEED